MRMAKVVVQKRDKIQMAMAVVRWVIFAGTLVWLFVCIRGEQDVPFRLVVMSDKSAPAANIRYMQHLNISAQMVGGPKLELEYVEVDDDSATSQETLCNVLETSTNFLVSLARKVKVRRMVRTIAENGKIPTIQALFSPWSYHRDDGTADTVNSVNSTRVLTTTSDNYITLIPAWTVMMNSMMDFHRQLSREGANITKQHRFIVLHDRSFRLKDSAWKTLLERVPLDLRYEAMKTNASDIREQINHLKQLNPPVNNILLLANTDTCEKFIMEAKDEIEANIWEWYVLTKDVRPFQCDDCQSANLFWLQADGDRGAFQRFRQLDNHIRKQQDEHELEYQVSSDTKTSLLATSVIHSGTDIAMETSFFLDIIYLAWDYLIAVNDTTAVAPGYGCFNQSMVSNKADANYTQSLKELMNQGQEGVFGVYEMDNNRTNWYFQNVLVIISKTIRKFAEPDHKVTRMMANWTITEGLSVTYDSLTQNPRNIKHYKVAIVIQPPFIERSSSKDNPYQGYCVDLIERIRAELGFTYTLYEVKDQMFGTANERNEWNGLIGDLINAKADIALAPLSVMAERENVVDFTVPYYDLVGTTILMKKPEMETSLFRFTRVLEFPVWICIFVAYFFTSVLLWIFDRFSPYSYTNNRDKYKDDPEKREFTFKECLWFCMTSLTPQGGGEAPKNISGRLVAATWWLFGFIIIASYTANLAAFLTVSRLETPISSLDDLAKQYKIEYAPSQGSASETYFRRMAEIEEKFYDIWKGMSLNESMSAQDRAKLAVWDYPVSDKFTNMWRYMQQSKLPKNTDDGIGRVLNSVDGFAYIGDATEIKYAQLTNCKLQQIGQEFSRKPYAIAVRQGSPLKDEISRAILTLLNKRELEALKDRWWHQNPNKKDCKDSQSEADGISIQNIGGVFIVILAGILLSIVTLSFEYFYYKNKPMNAMGGGAGGTSVGAGGNVVTVTTASRNGGGMLTKRGSARGIREPGNGSERPNGDGVETPANGVLPSVNNFMGDGGPATVGGQYNSAFEF